MKKKRKKITKYILLHFYNCYMIKWVPMRISTSPQNKQSYKRIKTLITVTGLSTQLPKKSSLVFKHEPWVHGLEIHPSRKSVHVSSFNPFVLSDTMHFESSFRCNCKCFMTKGIQIVWWQELLHYRFPYSCVFYF